MLSSPIKKWPSWSQWRQFFKILNKTEKIIFFSLFFLLTTSTIFLYINNTESRPAVGGTFVAGSTDQPRFINPIYASSDVDRELVELVYSGLMKYDENGNIVPDLAESVDIEESGTVYRVHLKDNLYWSDSISSSDYQKITSDDIVFTIQTIQNSDYQSPLRVNWIGVEVEKISDNEIIFRLKNPYSAFLEYLTVKILPKHIWQTVSAEQFPLSLYILKPVGSGPYKFEKMEQKESGLISSVSLKINPYSQTKAHFSSVEFKFFENESDLVSAAKKGSIDGFSLSVSDNDNITKSFTKYEFPITQYFAIFFNPDESKALSDLSVRQALNYATDKQEIVQKVFDSEATIVDSPIVPNIYGFSEPNEIYSFDIEEAKKILDEAGYEETENGVREKTITKEPAFQFSSLLKVGSTGTEVEELQKCLAKYSDIYPDGTVSGYFGEKTKAAVIAFQEKYYSEILAPYNYTSGTGSTGPATRTKLNGLCAQPTTEIVKLSITITTVDQENLKSVTSIIKKQWESAGIEVNIETYDINDLEKNIIKTRNYEAILFGEALGLIPDPFPFWDSLQIKDPGLNLAVYENEDVDELLENARQSLDKTERTENLEEFQDILIADAPAVFLYNPKYIYFISDEIKGVNEKTITDHSKIFSNMENWYKKTKRSWK
jgi:ABC-type transport system substrate-binding protein